MSRFTDKFRGSSRKRSSSIPGLTGSGERKSAPAVDPDGAGSPGEESGSEQQGDLLSNVRVQLQQSANLSAVGEGEEDTVRRFKIANEELENEASSRTTRASHWLSALVAISLIMLVVSSVTFDSSAQWLTSSIVEQRARQVTDDGSRTLMMSSRVNLESGWVEGWLHNDAIEWFGIRYAQPPTGPLRWRSTRPLAIGEQSAQRRIGGDYPSMCMQEPILSVHRHQENVVGSEDCLFLNVVAGKDPKEVADLRPVLVWIHGMGNLEGNGYDYDFSQLAAKKDVVVVTPNYRLSALGFFADTNLITAAQADLLAYLEQLKVPSSISRTIGARDLLYAMEFTRRTPDWFIADVGEIPADIEQWSQELGMTVSDSVKTLLIQLSTLPNEERAEALKNLRSFALDQSANLGLTDLLEVLNWIQKNIAQFGGDPDRVTLFGNGSGATNVLALMMSVLAKGKFHGAILQSPDLDIVVDGISAQNPASLGGLQRSSAEIVQRAYRFNALQFGAAVPSNDDASRWQFQTPPHVLLDRMRQWDGETVMLAAHNEGSREGVAMLIGDDFLFEGSFPQSLGERSPIVDVPVIIGSNRDETRLYGSLDPLAVGRFISTATLIDRDYYLLNHEVQSRASKIRGAQRVVELMTDQGKRDLYLYRFDWDEEPDELLSSLSNIYGAAHGFEVPFLQGLFRVPEIPGSDRLFPPSEERDHLSSVMQAYWSNFAFSGSPMTGAEVTQLPLWSRARQSDGFLVFDTTQGGGVRMVSEQDSFASLTADLLRTGSDHAQICRSLATVFMGRKPDDYMQDELSQVAGEFKKRNRPNCNWLSVSSGTASQ